MSHANYQDREEIYERQRRKMHDYKNQLSTIQTLIKNGHIDEALSFTQKLTESIAVEMSAINIPTRDLQVVWSVGPVELQPLTTAMQLWIWTLIRDIISADW